MSTIKVYNYWDFYGKAKQPFAVSINATWDLSKVGKITRNRVLRWLDAGKAECWSGQAAYIYNHLNQHFEIPKMDLAPQGYDDSSTITYSGITDEVYEKLVEVYQAEKVALRMSNENHREHYLMYSYSEDKPERSKGYFRVKHAPFFDDLLDATRKMFESEVFSTRINMAKQSLLNGGKITFEIEKV